MLVCFVSFLQLSPEKGSEAVIVASQKFEYKLCHYTSSGAHWLQSLIPQGEKMRFVRMNAWLRTQPISLSHGLVYASAVHNFNFVPMTEIHRRNDTDEL